MRAFLFLLFSCYYLNVGAQNLYVLSHDTMQVIKVGNDDLVKVVNNEDDTIMGKIECFHDSIRISGNLVALSEIRVIEINSKVKRVSSNSCSALSAFSIITAAFTTYLIGATHPVDMGNIYRGLLGFPIGCIGIILSRKYNKQYKSYELDKNGWQLSIR